MAKKPKRMRAYRLKDETIFEIERLAEVWHCTHAEVIERVVALPQSDIGKAVLEVDRIVTAAILATPEGEVKTVANTPPRKQSKREKVINELAASDLTARAVERDDIEYGPHTELPRGEHVANLKPAWKREPRQKGDKSR